MVRSDVGDYGDVCLEIIYIVKLETAEFEYINIEFLSSHLICITLTDVTAKTDIQASLLEQVVDE